MLGTENYATSFQSLMSPMYNVNANYSMNGYGMGAGYGLGYGGGYMGGMMTPMANVGVGQFNADYLIKDDSKNNNYYTRPIATHKKKDETGTILGIGAAALATIALLVAACKGKAPVTHPPIGPTGGRRPYVRPEVTERIVDPSRLLPSSSTVTQMPTSQGYTRTAITGNGRTGAIIDDATKAIKPGTRQTGLLPSVSGGGSNPAGTVQSGELTITNWGTGNRRAPFEWGGEYVPFTEITASNTGRVTGLLTANTNNVAGLLPAKSSAQLSLGPVESYLPQGSNFIRYPSGGARCNEHSKITGDMLRAEFGKIGLNINTKAFAELTPPEQRMINDLVMKGTPGKLQALTCNPQYEHLFSLL